MKRYFAYILMTLTLVACGGKTEKAPSVTNKPLTERDEVSSKEYTITDLFIAAQNSDLEEIRIILASGQVNVNEFNNGETVVLYAARFGQFEAVDELIKQGAFVHIPSLDGEDNIFSYLFKNSQTPNSFLKKLQSTDIKVINALELFNYAINKNKIDRLEVLMGMYNEQGIKLPLALQEEFDKNLILLAMEEDSVEMVEMFLTKGANINLYTKNGQTLLTAAVNKYGTKFADLFLDKYGAKIDQQDTNEMTALMRAVEKANVTGVEYLIKKGANKKIKDKNKDNACKHAKELSKKEFKQQRKEIRKLLGCFPYIF